MSSASPSRIRDPRQVCLIFASIVTMLVVLIGTSVSAPSTLALTNPCAADPNNLTTNGSMFGPGYAISPYGVVANGWSPFVLSPVVPNYEWVSYNSNGDVANSGSQYIWADLDMFDAGIYQMITGLSGGMYYRFWWGSALAAYDPGGGGNLRNNLIGRQVGFDTTGGTDPTAPRVQWGSVYWDGIAALNIPALRMVFAPVADRATIFLRVVNTNTTGRSKVWVDAICMELMNPQPTLPPSPAPVYLPAVIVPGSKP